MPSLASGEKPAPPFGGGERDASEKASTSDRRSDS